MNKNVEYCIKCQCKIKLDGIDTCMLWCQSIFTSSLVFAYMEHWYRLLLHWCSTRVRCPLSRQLFSITLYPQLWFSRLESWSRDVSRLVFQSLGLGLGLEHQSLGLGLETQSLGLGLEDLSLGLFVFFANCLIVKLKLVLVNEDEHL